MAALYLHNAIFSPDTQRPSHHIRNLSSLSAGTLRSSVSTYSHPTEPLLDSTTSESLAYRDLLLRQPSYPDGLQPDQDLRLSFDGDKTTAEEEKGRRVRKVKKQLRLLKVIKATLEVLFGAWAMHHIVVYFLAYTTYASKDGQAASLALGTSVTVSLALLMASALISRFRPYLLLHDMPIRSVLSVRAVLQYCSLFFLLAPALVNFALTFAWRDSSDNELRLQDRCAISIDVVWTAPGPNCHPSKIHPWGTWLALSIIRVLLTFIIITFYHLISRAYHNTRRPSSRRRRHHVRPSESTHGLAIQGLHLKSSNPTAQFTLASSPSHSSQHGVEGGGRLPNSRSFEGNVAPNSSDGDCGTPDNQPTLVETSPTSESRQAPDNDLRGFVERFKSLVTQITRETDDFAPSGNSSASDWNGSDDTFDPYLGYPAPVRASPDRIHVVGGVIHRMPTIESMGSHEIASLANSSLYRDRDGAPARSDPSIEDGSSPTRSNTRSHTHSSQSWSRRNSHEVGHKQNEIGELSGSGASMGGVPLISNRDSGASSYYTSCLSGEVETPPGL